VVNSSIVYTDEDFETAEAGSVVTRWFGVTAVVESDRSVKQAGAGKAESVSSDDGKSITFRASIESEDRAGDVIKAEGWELGNYKQNPVVLWAHRHDLLPIGKSIDIWVENGSLFATIEFAQTEFAQQVQKLFEGGFLRGVSVGFRALKVAQRGNATKRGTVFERQELLEISAAPVPMHPNALAADSEARKSNDSEQRELLPLFRQLTEIWQSIAARSK